MFILDRFPLWAVYWDGDCNDPVAILLLALAFTAVLIIIVDLDRSQEGILNVSQAAMTDLLG